MKDSYPRRRSRSRSGSPKFDKDKTRIDSRPMNKKKPMDTFREFREGKVSEPKDAESHVTREPKEGHSDLWAPREYSRDRESYRGRGYDRERPVSSNYRGSRPNSRGGHYDNSRPERHERSERGGYQDRGTFKPRDRGDKERKPYMG